MSSVKERWKKLNELQRFDEKLLDYAVVEQHKQMLEQLSGTGNQTSFIFDVYKQRYIYVTQNLNEQLGPNFHKLMSNNEIDVTRSMINLEDYELFEEMRLHFYTFLSLLPASQRKDYKLITSYRILNSHQEYVRFVVRQQVLELDARGNIWLVMGIRDLAPDQNVGQGFECSVLNYKTGKRLSAADFINNGAAQLTKREQEVLQLIKDGLLSKEISEKLSISIYTVNIHRQNILQKTDAGNAIEAIRFAEKMGFL